VNSLILRWSTGPGSGGRRKMKFEVVCPDDLKKDIDQAVSDLVYDKRRNDFRTITEWIIRTGIGQEGARDRLVREISQRLSKDITNGIVQITVENLGGEKEIKAKIQDSLPDFYHRIDIVIKSGVIDITTLTYWFKVSSKVIVDNLAVVLNEEKITGIYSGNLNAYLTLSFCGHDQYNESPFVLFENKKLLDLDLSKSVWFEEEEPHAP
jgi:hypothetical protein